MQRLRYAMCGYDQFAITVNRAEGWVFTFTHSPLPPASFFLLALFAIAPCLRPQSPSPTCSMAPKRKVDDGAAAGAAGKKNKKQVAAASDSTAADLKKGEGDWTSSSVKDTDTSQTYL